MTRTRPVLKRATRCAPSDVLWARGAARAAIDHTRYSVTTQGLPAPAPPAPPCPAPCPACCIASKLSRSRAALRSAKRRCNVDIGFCCSASLAPASEDGAGLSVTDDAAAPRLIELTAGSCAGAGAAGIGIGTGAVARKGPRGAAGGCGAVDTSWGTGRESAGAADGSIVTGGCNRSASGLRGSKPAGGCKIEAWLGG